MPGVIRLCFLNFRTSVFSISNNLSSGGLWIGPPSRHRCRKFGGNLLFASRRHSSSCLAFFVNPTRKMSCCDWHLRRIAPLASVVD